MKINKRIILLSATALALSSASVFATVGNYNASIMGFSEPAIAEATGLYFGRIELAALSTCTMDAVGTVSGNCDATGATALGAITLSGLIADTAYDITVTGSSENNLTFAAAGRTSGATAVVDTTNGAPTSFTTDGAGADVTLSVHGLMTVDADLVNGVLVTVGYTVEVTFQ